MLQRGMNWTEVATRAKHAVDGLTVIEHCTDCWLLRRLWMLQMQHAQNCRKLPATSRLQYRDTAFEAEWKIAVGKLLKVWFPKPVATLLSRLFHASRRLDQQLGTSPEIFRKDSCEV